MTPPTLAAVIANGAALTARGRVTEFLVATARALCDACVARALGIDPSTAYRAAVKIARSDGFARHYGPCSECGESRFVTAHRDVDLEVSGTVVACHDGDGAHPLIAPAREDGRLCRD